LNTGKRHFLQKGVLFFRAPYYDNLDRIKELEWMSNYLAIDIGKSGGRCLLGCVKDGKLELEDIHQFKNELIEKDGELCWDLEHLFQEIKLGLIKCREIGKLPIFIGIDTWGADFVLLDSENKVIGNAVSYLDSRTKGMDEKVFSVISKEQLYSRTGLENQIYSTIYQLMAVKVKHPEYLEQAQSLLMLPDYLNFLLCGKKRSEFTGAATSLLLNPVTKTWDDELIEILGYPRPIFQEISMPGTILSTLTREVTEEVGYDCIVVLPATNDIISATLVLEEEPDFIERKDAAALGNLLILMRSSRQFHDLKAARECVRNSFEIKKNG
jgi:rhamnulokinase